MLIFSMFPAQLIGNIVQMAIQIHLGDGDVKSVKNRCEQKM